MTIPAELELAIECLLRLTSAFGTGDAYDDLRDAIVPTASRRVGANDVDSAIARWAEANSLPIVPMDIDVATEAVVDALAAAHGASR